MKKQTIRLLIAVLCVIFFLPEAGAVILLNDGLVHDIDYNIYETIWIDYETPLAKTTVNLFNSIWIPGELHAYGSSTLNFIQAGLGSILFARDNSIVNFFSGSLGNDLYAEDNSVVNVSGGAISYRIIAKNNSVVNISGGHVIQELRVFGSAQVAYSGGSFDLGIIVGENGILTIEGTDFAVDGIPVDFSKVNISSGHITGMLDSGDILDTDFSILDSAQIYLMPEPSALLLLAAGVIFMRRNQAVILKI